MVEVEGARLQRRRLRRGLTIKELGEIAGLKPGTIGRLEKSRGPARITTVRKLAKALEVDAIDLLVGK